MLLHVSCQEGELRVILSRNSLSSSTACAAFQLRRLQLSRCWSAAAEQVMNCSS